MYYMIFVKTSIWRKECYLFLMGFYNNSDGLYNITKHKTSFFTKSFSQKFDIDYKHTFSPTLNIDCLDHIIIALAQNLK